VTQPPDDHMKALWQGQETETPTMTVKAIRALARNYGEGVRGGVLLGLTIVAFEAVVFGLQAWRAPNEVARAGDLIVLAGLVWFTWRIMRRWPTRLPETQASAQALVAFHRVQLERQQTRYANMMITVAPMIVGLLVLVYGLRLQAPQAPLARFAPFFILLCAWFVAAWFIQRRQARRLREQIAEMDDLAAP
jgi:hypothetical protein